MQPMQIILTSGATLTAGSTGMSSNVLTLTGRLFLFVFWIILQTMNDVRYILKEQLKCKQNMICHCLHTLHYDRTDHYEGTVREARIKRPIKFMKLKLKIVHLICIILLCPRLLAPKVLKPLDYHDRKGTCIFRRGRQQ